MALTAPPIMVAPPFLLVNSIIMILIDSAQPGPNASASAAAAQMRPFMFLQNRSRAAVELEAVC
jgi:hypothetical protein